jgi:hypothetical protein
MTANDDDGILVQPGDEGWTELCAACHTNGGRATQQQMQARRIALWMLTQEFQPATVRQIFYQATVHGIVAKTEAGYDQIQRCLVDLRLNCNMPFDWIVDNTRWMRKAASYTSLEEMLRIGAETYRRAVWADADCYVEVWCEKDALAGVLMPVTSEFDVPLMVARGYSSITFLKDSAEIIEARGKPAFIYHFGDWDPSGQDAADNIERRLREFAPDAEIYFRKIAVTPAQIAQWDLPTRPTKASDSRSVRWAGGDSVELDAIDPNRLRDLVRACIEQHIDQHKLVILRAAEASERALLRAWRPGERPAPRPNGGGGTPPP